MKLMGLFHRMQFSLCLVFGVAFGSIAALCISIVDAELTSQLRANTLVVARSVARSSVDILLNRDLAALQAMIEDFQGLEGIRYLYVADEHGGIIVHTFVPQIPPALLRLDLTQTGTFRRTAGSHGDITEVSVPILTGAAGSVHVGIDPDPIRLMMQQAVGRVVYLISALYILSILLMLYLFRRAAQPLNQLDRYMAQLLVSAGGPASLATQQLLERDDLSGQLARRVRAIAAGTHKGAE